jgi:biotin synthase
MATKTILSSLCACGRQKVPPKNQNGISQAEALEYLSLQEVELERLFQEAEVVRRRHFTDGVRLCAISNAKSGACPERCDFCAQSAAFGALVDIYPLKSARQMADEALGAEAVGARAFSLVTSGRGLRHPKEIDEVIAAIGLIARETQLECCASLGEIPASLLLRLKEAGLQRYHHNIETAPSFHPQIVHTHSFADEVRVVQQAREVGLAVCCGGILGMGESRQQQVEMALTLRELDPDSVPLNFLDPRPGTPLEGRRQLTPLDCLRLIAVFRLVLPQTPLLICGGRQINLGPLQHRMYHVGATGLMVGDYLTTSGPAVEADHRLIAEAGLRLAGPDEAH